jgi:hypothetical protein
VAVFSSAFVLGWQSSRLPTDYVSMANVSCRARGHDHVRGTHVSMLLYAPRWYVMPFVTTLFSPEPADSAANGSVRIRIAR